MSQHDEIELRLDADALAMLSSIVRGYRLGAPVNVVLDVVQEGLDRLLLQVVKAKRVTLRAAPAAAPAPAQAARKTFLCSCGQRTILADAEPE